MNFKQLCTDLSKYTNRQKAREMEFLMGHAYSFKGLDSMDRAKVMEEQLSGDKNPDKLDWEFIACCWEQNIREFQYFALQYLTARRALLGKQDLGKLKKLIVEKPGWDTNNILHRLLNLLTALYPELGDKVLVWSEGEDPWLKRAAILHQLNRGNYTDQELMTKIWANCLGDSRDFVQEALVEGLKNLQTAQPALVEDFIKRHADQLSPHLRAGLDLA